MAIVHSMPLRDLARMSVDGSIFTKSATYHSLSAEHITVDPFNWLGQPFRALTMDLTGNAVNRST